MTIDSFHQIKRTSRLTMLQGKFAKINEVIIYRCKIRNFFDVLNEVNFKNIYYEIFLTVSL
jgi:hypothetical protein